MLAVFRADASIDIGSGHIMRCMTLANSLMAHGYDILFVCRELRGNLISLIQETGFTVLILDDSNMADQTVPDDHIAHASWLGVPSMVDAYETLDSIQEWLLRNQRDSVDLLIVDHYALDHKWESYVRKLAYKCLVIDDLADRAHDCDVLLDQSFMREKQAYLNLVPQGTILLLGSEYSLLRSEFFQMRERSLIRRKIPDLKNILISLGGVDKDNITQVVLEKISLLKRCDFFNITVVLGSASPWLSEIQDYVKVSNLNVTLLQNVSNMAELLIDTDLAIGAAGASTWERCVLGVPTLMLVLASNQEFIASQLANKNAVILMNHKDPGCSMEKVFQLLTPEKLSELSSNSAAISDGKGVSRVINCLIGSQK